MNQLRSSFYGLCFVTCSGAVPVVTVAQLFTCEEMAIFVPFCTDYDSAFLMCLYYRETSLSLQNLSHAESVPFSEFVARAVNCSLAPLTFFGCTVPSILFSHLPTLLLLHYFYFWVFSIASFEAN
jgi:hypothetical protein